MALPLQAPFPTTWSTWKKLTPKLPSRCSKGGNNSGSLPNKVCMCVHMDPLYWAISRNVNCEEKFLKLGLISPILWTFFPQCLELVSLWFWSLSLNLLWRPGWFIHIFLGIYFQTQKRPHRGYIVIKVKTGWRDCSAVGSTDSSRGPELKTQQP